MVIPVPVPQGTCPLVACGVASPSGGLVSSVFAALATWLSNGAAWLVQHVVQALLTPGSVQLAGGAFGREEHTMAEIAVLLVAPLLGVATIGAVLRQDTRRLLRVWAVGVPVAGVGTLVGVVLAGRAVALVDDLCSAVAGPRQYQPFGLLGSTLRLGGAPSLVTTLVGSVVVVGAVLLWMELLLRNAVVYLSVFFLPLGLAAFVWPATAQVTKRFVELLAAVIVAKFVIVATLSLGGALVEQAKGGVDAAVTGAAVLLLAAFAPFAVLRLVPLVEIAAVAHMEGMSRRPVRAAAGVASAGEAGGAGAIGAARWLLGRSGAGRALVGAESLPEREGDWSPGQSWLRGAGGGAGAGGSPSPSAAPSAQAAPSSAPAQAAQAASAPSAPAAPSAPEDAAGAMGLSAIPILHSLLEDEERGGGQERS